MKRYEPRPLLLWLFLFLCIACGHLFSSGKVRLVAEQMPLTFEFRGRGNLWFIYVDGPFSTGEGGALAPQAGYDSQNPLWRIHGPEYRPIPLNDLPSIAYGRLPPGWEQVIPKTGTPPPLIDGAVYYIAATTSEGRSIHMCVLIRDGKPQVHHGKYKDMDCDKE